jgi:hypothetical protein
MGFFVEKPELAGVVGEEIFAGETLSDGETFGTFTDKHDVSGVLHNGFGDERDVLDVANAADGTGAAGGSVHARGVEFDDAFFVGQASEADGVVVGIVFGAADDAQGGVESVGSGAQHGVAFIEIIVAIVGRDDDGTLTRGGLGVGVEGESDGSESSGG